MESICAPYGKRELEEKQAVRKLPHEPTCKLGLINGTPNYYQMSKLSPVLMSEFILIYLNLSPVLMSEFVLIYLNLA